MSVKNRTVQSFAAKRWRSEPQSKRSSKKRRRWLRFGLCITWSGAYLPIGKQSGNGAADDVEGFALKRPPDIEPEVLLKDASIAIFSGFAPRRDPA